VVDLPDGTVTFLFTDVEGSTQLWEDSPDSMMEALNQHDLVIEKAAEGRGGVSVKPRGEGDSRFLVFSDATAAVGAVAEMQRGLTGLEWTTPRPLLVRMALHTMGEHGLKDLTRPERVYQIDIEGLPNTFPPLASLDATPNNLPVQLTDFVGRQSELEDTKRIIGETRLLTILAPGGAGKTRLAIQAAAELADDFPDGVYFVDFAPINSPDDIIQTVAESLGLSLSTDENMQTQLLAYLAHKRQLLVFDNFEHLGTGTHIVSEILTNSSHVRVIATSRSKLNVSGETVMALRGLETKWDNPEDAFHTSSVHLFINAAKRADASFSLTVDDLEPLGRILQLVDGLPLGILLAAAWVDMLPIPEIDAEISRSIDFLETEVDGVPDRHRSMRAVFDYSARLPNKWPGPPSSTWQIWPTSHS
jgi:hypothetical protein